jgi:crotonobetainyl-CoA:carnitine CoA-transferase CaiB-like acyl-CoA transferase
VAEGPFEGLNVVEFGQYVSIPYCAELFANGGADVVKIEPVTGDETRHNSRLIPGEGRQYIIKSRGKRGLPVDLGQEAGRDLARRLVDRADVVLSNMRPGALERLGLDYASTRQRNPGVIFGEISAYGIEGPRGGLGAVDGAIQAYSGLMISGKGWDDDHPLGSEAFLGDYMAAALLAFGVTTALNVRERTGAGQQVSTTLLQAALALQHGTANVFHGFDGWKDELVTDVANGGSFEQALERRRAMQPSDRWFYNTYATADGFVTVAAPPPHHPALAAIMGLDDERLFLRDWQLPDDPRPMLRELSSMAREAMRQLRAADVIAACDEAGIPCAPVQTLEEALLGEQASANGFAERFDHPAVGPVTMPSVPVNFSAAGYHTRHVSPAYGEHTTELMEELRYSSDDVARLVENGVIGFEGTLD